MDPVACVRRFVEAMECDDFEEAIDAREDLREWLHKGGDMSARWGIEVGLVARLLECLELGVMLDDRRNAEQIG